MTNDRERDTAPIGHGDRVAATRASRPPKAFTSPRAAKAPSPRTADPPSWSSSTTRHRPATSTSRISADWPIERLPTIRILGRELTCRFQGVPAQRSKHLLGEAISPDIDDLSRLRPGMTE